MKYVITFILLCFSFTTNAKELFAQKDVDGGLIGGASLKADDFISIINSFNK